ncbi:MAG: GAF domain-containing protein [Gemmatimonadetes bacterium]|nr:GAF domain-containing protein [Gemmatimonadota bacterium]
MNSGTAAGDLVLVGALSAALSPDDLGSSLDAAAELLRAAAAADDCEIFLCEPEGGDLVLTACCGPDRDALMERVRFEPGVGYPGIVAATGEPLVTHQLDRDRRFLRPSVTERGIVSFVSVPLWGAEGPLGCIDLAWRDVGARIERGAELLSRAARPIATTVRAALLAARELVGRAVEGAGPGLVPRGRASLDVMVRFARAGGGTLVLYDPDGGETMVLTTGQVVAVCADAVDGRLRCRPLAQAHGVVLGPCRSDWPTACGCLPKTTVSPVCLPLRSDRRLHGVVVLDRGSVPPTPVGRDLVLLLTMAAEAATRLAPRSAQRSPVGATPASGTPVLELRCFGAFDVRLRGEPVPAEAFTRKKALTLLKLLVLSAGNPVSRDALIERLWPGADPKTGANRLHGVMHALRSAIEPFREQRRWIYVCNIGELYYFNMESPHWIDVYAFRRHAASALEAERRGQREEAIRHLEAALLLYRGDLFADEPYTGWCELERMELKHRYVDLTGRVAELWAAAGDPDRGVEWLRRGLLADPLREDLHQVLIRLLIGLGRRQEARAQYQACVRLLHDELGAEPLPETRRLEPLATGSACPPSRGRGAPPPGR